MKAVVHTNNASHQQQHAAWMRDGLERHGIDVSFAAANVPTVADLVVIWGWKQRRVIEAARTIDAPILVMERAHLQPRMEWTSCGLNGLANRATYAPCEDGGERWRKHFAHLEQPWRWNDDGYVLICGQVLGDAALWGCDFHKWAQGAADTLRGHGRDVVYRPHPFSLRQGDLWCPHGARFSGATLAEDLAGAAQVLTYNSTAGVETALAGVPTGTMDQGAMAWPVSTHGIDEAPARPDRTRWMHELAWTSWRPSEIASGETWAHLRRVL